MSSLVLLEASLLGFPFKFVALLLLSIGAELIVILPKLKLNKRIRSEKTKKKILLNSQKQ